MEVYWVIHVKNALSLTFLDEIDCLSATNELLHSVILVKDVNDPPLCKFKRTNFGVQQIMSGTWLTNLRCVGQCFVIRNSKEVDLLHLEF